MTDSKNNSTKTFCPLPWIHLATRPNGDVRVCCTANASGAGVTDDKEVGLVKRDGVAMNVRDHTIEEVWNSEHMRNTRLQMLNGEVPASCRKCFEEESKGIKSKRNWETEVWKERIDVDSIVAQTNDDGSLPVNIPYFDLRLGNMCNLKCVMCSPHDSSSWIKDWKLQYPQYKNPQLKEDQGWNPNFDYTWYKKGSFLDSMKNQAQHIKELYFAGGEPLMIPEHYDILEFMVAEGHAKNCILRYNSNGTEINDTILKLWTNFKQVKFNFSIDAIHERNDYIRYPSKFKQIEQNLKLLDDTPDNIIINIACAVQALNVHHIVDLAEWKLQQNFKKINKAPFGAGIIGLHLVYLPSYMNVRVLPKEIKEKVSAKITNFATHFLRDFEFNTNPYGKERWLGLVNYMNAEDWSHKLPALQEYLKISDKTREQDFVSVFPELEIVYGPN
jgi:MoaA/NifB/PqqE/SkfB family radical SAM enzyme